MAQMEFQNDSLDEGLSSFAGVNQIDVIKQGRFKRVLFTTFTLNLAYFEGHVLPQLHNASCDDITILVDERFYHECLSELGCRDVGISYRLLPVRLEQGYFHAKLTYLWNEAGRDILMVGSGNLTLAGWGRQLECLHILDSERHSVAFRDLSRILAELGTTPRVRLGSAASIVQEFSLRAEHRASAARKQVTERIRLLGSVKQSISKQVVTELVEASHFAELVVISPFHDETARPLREMAKQLGISRVKVVVDNRDGTTPVRVGTKGVSFVRRVADDDQRPTHAKWYEFRGPVTWILSGSVNATHTSLETSNNFEVASLRPVGDSMRCKWESTIPSESGPARIEQQATSSIVSLTATLKENNTIVGEFLAGAAMDGIWHALMLSKDMQIGCGRVVVANGGFELSVPAGALADDSSPCRLVFSRNGQTAICWIMFAASLGMSREQRDFSRKLAKLCKPDADEDDFLAIVSWLGHLVGQIGTSPLRRAAGVGAAVEVAEVPYSGRPFNYNGWIHGPTNVVRGQTLGMCRIAFHALAQFHSSQRAGPVPRGDFGHQADFHDDKGQSKGDWSTNLDTQVQTVVADRLEPLAKALVRQLGAENLDDDSARFLLEALLWVLIVKNLRDRFAPLDSIPFVQWRLHAEPDFFRLDDDVELAELTLAAMCCAIAFQGPSDTELESCLRTGKAAASRLALGVCDCERNVADELARSPSFSSLSKQQRFQAQNALARIRDYQSFGERLSAFLATWKERRAEMPIPSDLDQLTNGVLRLLNQSRSWTPRYKEFKSKFPTSCDCRMSFNPGDVSELKSRRAMTCRGCGQLVFWTGGQ